MRKFCPRCKSSSTRVISPKMMLCLNCRFSWGMYSGTSASGKKIGFQKKKKPKRNLAP